LVGNKQAELNLIRHINQNMKVLETLLYFHDF